MTSADPTGGTGAAAGAGRVAFLGSGAFGVPTLERLARRGEVSLVVSQPARPAGRGREVQPTPVAAAARSLGLPILESADVGAAPDAERIRAAADELVVIAFGQKLPASLLRDRFAINLHGSILPRWRGAAPIQRAVMEGDREVGVSVIALADRMDAGEVYATASTAPGDSETAGELHDRLSLLGPDLVTGVLEAHRRGTLRGAPQDESLATRARKLSRGDAWVDLAMDATRVAARINGLAPWPGCDATIDGAPIRLLRARTVPAGDGASPAEARASPAAGSAAEPVGTVDALGRVRCGRGMIELLEVQSPGGRPMPMEAWRRGRPRGAEPSRLRSEPRVVDGGAQYPRAADAP